MLGRPGTLHGAGGEGALRMGEPVAERACAFVDDGARDVSEVVGVEGLGRGAALAVGGGVVARRRPSGAVEPLERVDGVGAQRAGRLGHVEVEEVALGEAVGVVAVGRVDVY